MPLIVHRGLLLTALLLPLSSAHAQSFDKSWTGQTSSNWHTVSNWDPSGVPATNQTVLINNQGFSLAELGAPGAAVTDVSIGVGELGQLTVGANGVLQTYNVIIGATAQAGPITAFGNGLLRLNGNGARLSARTGGVRVLGVGVSQSQGTLEVLNGAQVDGSFDITAGFGASQGDILVSGNSARINLGTATTRRIDLLGNSRLIVRDAGLVSLGGTIDVQLGAQLAVGAAALQPPQGPGGLSAGTINLAHDDSRLTLNHTGTATVVGNIQGIGELRAFNGRSILTGTVSGGVDTLILQDAVLQFGNGGSTGALTGNAVVAGGIEFNRSNDYTYSGVISGPGGLVKGGSGRLILTTAHTYTGGTSIFSGPLELANGGRITGAMQNNFAVLFNQSDSWTWSGNSLGSGVLVKRGSGTLTLTGTHAHSGATQVDQGTLRFAAGGLNNAGSPVFVGTNLTQLARLVGETGTVLTTGPTILGANAGSQAEVDLSNSVWTVSGDVVVGSSGRATLDVRNGTSMIVNNIGVAASSAESSTLRVQGTTSSISAANFLVVGGNGPGTGLLEILQGAQFSAGEVRIGTAAGRTVQDRVALSGDALLEVLQTYSQGSASMLQVTLSAAGGGRVQVDETATISPGATLRVLTSGFTPPTGSQYTLLSAAGGLTGSYTLDTSIPDATLVHTANSVILQVGEITDEIFQDRFQ